MEDFDIENEAKYPEKTEDIEFIEAVHRNYRDALDATKDWREEAENAYNFVANQQWAVEDQAELALKNRPLVVFNRTEVFVQAVVGLEAINRQEVRYLPRREGPTGVVADIWSDVAKYVNDDCDAEDQHSAAFRDMVICGMGWTDVQMKYLDNPEGDIDIDRHSPLMHYWDPRATQRCLADTRWRMRVIPMSEDEVLERWPDAAEELSYSRIFEPGFEPVGVHDATNAWKYENDQSRSNEGLGVKNLWVVKYQWYETDMYYRVKDPRPTEQGGTGTRDMPAGEWKAYKEKFPEIANLLRVAGPIPKRRFRCAWINGWTLLQVDDLPSEDFTMQCMTGKHDQLANVWYGLYRALKDPQEWTNKFFSQIMHIINSNAKGGLLAEKNAFDSITQAEASWARADQITWARDGAIRDGRITDKRPIPYPEGLDRLLSFCLTMFVEVTGMNLELLGMADKVQPGVLEAQRKQAGMTMLAWAFDSMRMYRKKHGRVLASFIQEFVADGRLIRIAGDIGEEYIALTKDKLAKEYDVVVAESPSSVNEKERILAIMGQLGPTLKDMGVMPPKEVLDYIPLPVSLVEKWKKQIKGGEDMQAQMSQMQQKLEQLMAQADIKKTEAEAAHKQAQAQSEPIKAQAAMIKATA